jgi:hypothetical protein
MRVAGGNIAGRRKVRRLRALLRHWRPDFVVLTEAYWARPFLLVLAATFGYQLRQYARRHGAEAPGIAVLIRKATMEILERELVKMRQPWWGPFNFPRSKRRPRRFSRFALRHRQTGQEWDTEAIHGPPGGPRGGILTRGKNAPAWAEFADHERDFLAGIDLGFATGDFNADGADLRKHIATEGVQVAMASGVDGVAAKGAHVTMHRLDAPAGMHGWFVADLTPKENR